MRDFKTNDIPRAPVVDLPPPTLTIHCDEITNIIQEVGVNFREKRRLHLDNAKTFYNEGGIHTIQLKMHTEDLLDPCKARELIVDLVEALVKKLNDNMYLVPEFANVPFLPSNFEIYIACDSFYARYVDPYYIKCITLEDGIVHYYAADLEDNSKDCWHSRRESYKTSYEIAFFKRRAEAEYKKKHSLNLDLIFGDQRYVPPEEE